MAIINLLRSKKEETVGRSPLELLKVTVGNINKLPMFPQAATQALAVANDPNSSLQAFAGLIERDPVLAAGVLKLANSPLYRTGRIIESVNQAVVRLGVRECKNLILAVGMRSLHRGASAAKQQQCEVLWRHAFVTACLCRRLNQRLELGFQGEEFSAGLSHDLGRILVAVGAPDAFDAADLMDFQEGPGTLERERQVLGTDHCYFGAWFAHLNQLPASISSAMEFHHTPETAASHKELVALVAAADDMANHLQRQQSSAGYDLASNRGWQTLSARDVEKARPGLAASLPALMDEAFKEASEAAAG